jgi:hypothetical protein
VSARRWTRRGVLAGAGGLLALPWFESRAGDEPEPARFIGFYVPNGMPMATWHEDGSPILAALDPVRDRVSVITGLNNAPAAIDGAGHHAAGTAGFLTATRPTRSDHAPRLGPSLDQRYAAHVAGATAWASLPLGLEGGGAAGNCDNGFACAYSRSISWADAITPLPKLGSARVAFDLLFGGGASNAAARRTARRSVIDPALGRVERLRRELSASDVHGLDDYLESLRALERRIDAPAPACGLPEAPDDGDDVHAAMAAMIDLIVLAVRCDMTRAITFMLGNSASDRDCAFLGLQGTHHGLSHHAGDPDKLAALATIGAWEVGCFAALVAGLDNVAQGDGTLLDHCAVLFGSELSDPNSHRHDDLPILLAGRLGGALHPGRTIAVEPDRPLGDLLLTLARGLGLPDASFGDDGTRVIAEL